MFLYPQSKKKKKIWSHFLAPFRKTPSYCMNAYLSRTFFFVGKFRKLCSAGVI